MHNILERLFRLQEKGTSVKTELLAGVTTFIALAYIMLRLLHKSYSSYPQVNISPQNQA